MLLCLPGVSGEEQLLTFRWTRRHGRKLQSCLWWEGSGRPFAQSSRQSSRVITFHLVKFSSRVCISALERLVVMNEMIWYLKLFPNQVLSKLQSCSSVAQSCSTLFNPMDARLSCSSPTPGVYSNSCPLSRWCHPTISSSVVPFSACLHSFPASWSFQMSQLFTSGGQSIGVSASTSVPPMNTQDWSPLGWTGWVSLQSKDSQESSPTPQFKSINSSVLSFLYSPTLTSIHDYWKNHSFD